MRPRVLIPAATAAVLVVVAALAASVSRISVGSRDSGNTLDRPAEPGLRPDAGPTATEPPVEPLAPFDWPAWTAVVGWVLALTLAMLVLVTAWRQRRRRAGVRRRRRRHPAAPLPRPTDAAANGPELVAAIDESLAVLAGDTDPRAAVIACWVRLQAVAGAAGVAGRPTDTADDLVWRLLRSRQVSEQVLADLAEVYRLARYSPHPVDERMSEEARAALRQLREALEDGGVRTRM